MTLNWPNRYTEAQKRWIEYGVKHGYSDERISELFRIDKSYVKGYRELCSQEKEA